MIAEEKMNVEKELWLMRRCFAWGGSLTSLGEAQVQDVTQQMVALGMIPDTVLHSPQPEAKSTADKVCRAFGQASDKRVSPILAKWLNENNARVEFYRETHLPHIHILNEEYSRILVVTHLTNIYHLTRHLANQAVQAQRAQMNVVKSGVQRWCDFNRGMVGTTIGSRVRVPQTFHF